MGGSVGNISFADDLFWVTEPKRPSLISEKRALDGTVVQSWLSSQASQIDEQHTFRFTWVPRSTVQALRNLKKLKTTFTLKTSSGSSSLTCRFIASEDAIDAKPVPPEDFFSSDAVEGTPLDLWNGEIKVWVRR